MISEILRRPASVLLCALVAFITLFASGWAAPARAATFPCSVGPSDIPGLSFANAGDGSFQLGGVLTVGNISATSGGCNTLTSPTSIRPLVNGVATVTLNQPVTNATSQGGTLLRTVAGEVQYRPPSPSFSGTDTFTLDNNNTNRVINVTVNVAPASIPPSVTSISPTSGPTGGGTTVVITGTQFSGATAVVFGATTATAFTVDSATQITATAPAGTGTVDVRVTTGAGTSATSAADQYTYLAAPTVSAIAPTSGPTGGGTTVTITGTNFAGTSAVTFGATAATGFTVNSATQITATAPAGTGTVNVRVTTGGGTSATSAANQYSYIAAPTVSAIAPTSGPGGGGTTVTITGTNLSGATAVTFGGTAATGFTVNSATQITATAPAGTGTVNIRATTAGGTSATGSANQYSYIAAPTVTSVSPTSGPTAGGNTVTITGTNFTGATAVTFGATQATGFIINSATQITATAPAGTGTVDLRVTTGGGTSATSAADQYTYLAAPTVSAISPTAGPTAGGTTVVINGANLSGATAVTFGGTSAAGFTVNSATQITATAPAGTGTVDVRVTTAGGTSAISTTDQYTYIAAPTVTSASPSSGTTAGGTTVVITGANLSGATAVTFGGTAAAGFTVDSATQITATTPAGTGTVDIGVATPGGTGQLAGAYTYVVLSAPSVTTQPLGQTVAAGATATFSAAGSGSPSPTVQWQVSTNGGASYSAISGANATSYTTPATTPSDNGAVYRAVFTNSQGTATSAAAALTVVSAPTADGQSLTVAYQTASALTLTGSDPNTPPRTLTYAVATAPTHGALSGAAPNLTYTPATGYSGPDSFTFTVSNGVSTSAPATVNVTVTPSAPTVLTQPSSQTVTAGATATFTAAASSSPTVQWQASSDGGVSWTDIVGAASTSYTTPATTIADSGKRLRAVFTNTGGAATTSAAVLTVVAPTVTVAPATLSNATVGVAYSQTVTAGGGVAPYSYAITAGALPAGMTLGSGGVLSGTPTAGGSFTFTVTANDSSTGGGPFSGSRAYTLVVAAPTLVIAPASLPNGVAGTAYSQTLTTSGGTGPYSYAVTAGALPSGITLAASGALSGTPTTGGTFNVTITVTDASTGVGPYTGSRAYTLTMAAPSIVITPTTLPNATAGAAYSQTISANGGAAPYSYAVTAGALPAGVSLSSAGVLSGTPGSSGSFNFTITTTDSSGGSGPYSASQAYALTVDAAVLTLAPTTLPGGQSGVVYSQTLSASGGVAPYRYAVTAGALPAGLTLNTATGAIDGAPTAQGAFTFTATATDSSTGAGPVSVSQAYSVVIAAPTIVIAPASLPAGAAGVAYSQSLSASGGVAPYAYAISAGALPPGMSLSSAGAFSGVPTAAGSFTFTVTATDATTGATAPYGGARAYTLVIDAPSVTIDTAVLPAATTAVAYSQTLSASGGTAPYSYAVAAGALPAGVSLSSGGVLSGTPTQGGSFAFTVTATDSSGGSGPFSASRALTLTVNAPTIALTPTTLANGQVEAVYSQTLSASGGTAPYNFSVTAGALPSGLSLSTAGLLSGTPMAGGSFNFTVAATDSSTGSGPFAGSQAYALVITAPNPPVAGDVSATVDYGSTDNPIAAALSGASADSVAVATAPAHGVVSVNGRGFLYTPTADYFGPDSFTYTASNAGGASAPATVSISVGAPPAPTAANRSGVAVAYDSSGQAIDLSASISGVYASVAVATAPAHGVTSVSGAVVTYTPTPGYYGPDSFTYTATGPGGTSSAATVSLTVATPAPPAVTPPAPIVVPPSAAGPSAPISIDLGARTQGVTDGYRITVDPRFGSGAITSSGAATTAQSLGAGGAGPQAAAETFALVYTPAANFIGTDTVTVVAFGPGGDSAPATFTFQVAGKAPDLSGSVASSGTLTVSPTATLVGGPFQALRITRQPAFGAATVQGLNIVFTPGVANVGSTSLDYVIDLPFGSSAAGRLDLTVGQVPASQTLVADTIQGRPVTVRISDAAGGPFTGAAIASISPTTAGSATIAGTGGVYDLTFTPQGTFSGQATIAFTLTNASGTSTGTLTVTVQARPDPSLDPDVRGVASGQITAARRFSDTQVDNFQRRLEGLRNGSNGSQNGLSLNFGSGGQDDRDPRVALSRQLGQDQRLDPGALGDDRERDMLGLTFGSDRSASAETTASQAEQADQLNAAPVGQGAPEGGRSVGVWTSGSVDWGRQDARGQRDSRFTTQGVTAGLDVRLNDRLIVGGGLGYGEDKTRIGDNGSVSRGQAATGALYASWRPADGWFADGVIGLSRLDFDSRRWVAGLLNDADGYAEGERSGEVRFASASVGRTLRRQGLTADLYVRMEGRDIALDGFTETRGGVSALTWDALDQSGLSVNLGASWRWTLESRRFGVVRPTARLEWSHELEDIESQGVRYADWAVSPTYLVPLDGWSRDSLNLDLGAEWSLSDRLMLSLGYRGMLGDASASHGGQIGLKYGW